MTKLYEVELNSKGMPNFSTAKEVPQRMKGRWVDDGEEEGEFISYHVWHCSECGDKLAEVGKPQVNYCAMCGADMRETE